MNTVKLINGEKLSLELRDWLLANIGGYDSKWSYDSYKNELIFRHGKDATYFSLVHVPPEPTPEMKRQAMNRINRSRVTIPQIKYII